MLVPHTFDYYYSIEYFHFAYSTFSHWWGDEYEGFNYFLKHRL